MTQKWQVKATVANRWTELQFDLIVVSKEGILEKKIECNHIQSVFVSPHFCLGKAKSDEVSAPTSFW